MRATGIHSLWLAAILAAQFACAPEAVGATWTGGSGTTSNWTDAANWGGTAPVAGEALIFAGATRLANTNDFAAGTTFASITFNTGGFSLTGNAVNISGGATAITDNSSVTPNTMGINITFTTAAPTWTVGATAGSMQVTTPVNNGGFTLTTVCNGVLVFQTVVSGAGGIVKNGAQTLFLSGANTYGGTTVINNGQLTSQNANAIPNGSAVTINSPGSLRLNGVDETIGALDGNGGVDLGFGRVLTINQATNTTYSGVITGLGAAAAFIKQGTGTLILTGSSPAYASDTRVRGGTLLINGTLGDGGLVYAETTGTLGGSGSVGTSSLNLLGTSTFNPGPTGGTGIFTSGTLFINVGATPTFAVDLASSTTPGTGHDQLNVTGTVTLTNVSLTGTLGFAPAAGAQFVIINNDAADAVTGTFTGLPQGATVTLGTGLFTISYTGGSGNDVVLTFTGTALPVVTTTVAALSYTEASGAAAIDTGVTVTDANDASLAGATISITNNFTAAEDSLSFTNAGAITGSYNTGTGVLTLTGTDTVANYQAALRAVRYTNSSKSPNTATRRIQFVARDATANGAAVTRDITVISVNDAPTITSGPTATPNPATTGASVAFTVAATDDAPGVVISWDFGDGSTNTTNSASVSHAFAAAGSFTVRVTARDAGGLSATGTVVVQVTGGATAGDSDADGWSDEIEQALGTNSQGANSTPFGLPRPVSDTGLTITSLTIQNKRLTMTGDLPSAAGIAIVGKTAIVSINGVVRGFALDEKGISVRLAKDFFGFTTVRKGTTKSGKFKMTLRGGDYSAVNGSVNVNLIFGNKSYVAPATVNTRR